MSAHRVPLIERLAKYTNKGESCWIWTGAVSNEYGYISDDWPSRKRFRVHRLAYEIANGPIPPGLVIDHLCHNTLCLRPSHLRAVTNKQNAEHKSGPHSNNTSGYLGVERARNRWFGIVRHFGMRHRTPMFDTAEEANDAVKALRLSLFTHNDIDRRTA